MKGTVNAIESAIALFGSALRNVGLETNGLPSRAHWIIQSLIIAFLWVGISMIVVPDDESQTGTIQGESATRVPSLLASLTTDTNLEPFPGYEPDRPLSERTVAVKEGIVHQGVNGPEQIIDIFGEGPGMISHCRVTNTPARYWVSCEEERTGSALSFFDTNLFTPFPPDDIWVDRAGTPDHTTCYQSPPVYWGCYDGPVQPGSILRTNFTGPLPPGASGLARVEYNMNPGGLNHFVEFQLGLTSSFFDIQVTKEAQTLYPVSGENLDFYLTVYNDGPDMATNVTLSDHFPGNYTFQGATSTEGVFETNTTDLLWHIPGISPGADFTATYSGHFTTPFPCTQSKVVNSAKLFQYDGDDTDIDNDLASVEIELCPLSLTGTAYIDLNGNGLQDAGEDPLSGVNIQLQTPIGEIATTTSTDGSWLFINVPNGPVTITQELPTGFFSSYPPGGFHEFVLDGGVDPGSFDFGYQPEGESFIHIHKFWDRDGDGEFDDDEGGMNEIEFIVTSAGEPFATAFTHSMDINEDGFIDPRDETGLIWLEAPPGEYNIEEVVPPGMQVTTPGGASFPITVNNNISIVVTVGNGAPYADWGDLPDPREDLPFPCPIGEVDLECYRTLAGVQGAAHMLPDALGSTGMVLGGRVDADPNGQPNVTATGDDDNISSVGGTDDEDGLIDIEILPDGIIQMTLTALVRGGGSQATLDVFIDLNDDGVMNDGSVPGGSREHVIHQGVVSGLNIVQSPAGTFQEGDIIGYVRMRLSKRGTVYAWGGAPEGEVEDYVFHEFDFGDAPNSVNGLHPEFPFGYPTTQAQNGAVHRINPNVILGEEWDGELDGLPNYLAEGDDLDNLQDEDGVDVGDGFAIFSLAIYDDPEVRKLVPGTLAGGSGDVLVYPSTNGILDAWVDFNRDGDWDDAGERVANNLSVSPPEASFRIEFPEDASLGFTYARFRFSTAGVDSPDGIAPDGEVEDYLIVVIEPTVLTSDGDTRDASPGDGVCDDGSGNCTLRAFIEEINASGNAAALLDGTGKNGAFLIQPQSPLPPIRTSMVIALGDQSIIDGSQAGPNAIGLDIQTSGVSVFDTELRQFGGDGVRIEGDNNFIGSTSIHNNGGGGVVIVSGTGNTIERTTVYGNGGLGIDLGNDGVTANDPGDPDEGANHLLNRPVLDLATAENRTIEGSYSSIPDTPYIIEFFSSPSCDASGSGEGQVFLFSTEQTTDETGTLAFSIVVPDVITIGESITATATSPEGDTSEFSTCLTAISTSIERIDEIELPKDFTLGQNYPNPFNPVTTITFGLSRGEFVTLEVFDLLGKRVKVLVSEYKEQGEYTVTFEAAELPSGLYLYRMTAGNFTASKQLTLLK